MKHGFSIDADLCVNCKACVAACTFENGFQPGTRNVFTYNKSAVPALRVFNLSLSCNHCATPACLTGCPAKAYRYDDETGAIIHDPLKCMGCGFCTWRCPFDAPKMNPAKGHIEKCNLCINRINEGVEPACVTACPTGALKHIIFDDQPQANPLLPKTDMTPSLHISGKDISTVPAIYPSECEEAYTEKVQQKNTFLQDWSLFAFSSLITIAAGFTFAEYTERVVPHNIMVTVFLLVSLALSFVHLGKISRAWRALTNVKTSPLSREIMVVSAFTGLSVLRLFVDFPALNTIIAVLALLSLITIDLVYLSTDKTSSIVTHSGQTLFSGLLIASYYSLSMKMFALLTVVAVASAVFRNGESKNSKPGMILFYLRQLFLLLPLVIIAFKLNIVTVISQTIVLSGVIIDRVLFYIDFKPENIRYHIQNLFADNYEKDRSKQSANTNIP